MSTIQIDSNDLSGSLELDIDLPTILGSISFDDVTAAIKSTFGEDDLITILFDNKSEIEELNILTKIIAAGYDKDNSAILKLLIGNPTKIECCHEFAQHFVTMLKEMPILKEEIEKETVWQEHLETKAKSVSAG